MCVVRCALFVVFDLCYVSCFALLFWPALFVFVFVCFLVALPFSVLLVRVLNLLLGSACFRDVLLLAYLFVFLFVFVFVRCLLVLRVCCSVVVLLWLFWLLCCVVVFLCCFAMLLFCCFVGLLCCCFAVALLW